MTLSPRSEIALRRIGADDWRLWRALRLDALAEAPYAFGSKLADWQGAGDTEPRWRARLADVPLNVIAEVDGTPAGMVSGIAADETGTIELISMWVAPFARGRGVGDALVGAVVAWGRSMKATHIALGVVESNARARALYVRHAFVDAGPYDCTGSGIAVGTSDGAPARRVTARR